MGIMARAGTARVPVEEGSAVMQTDVVRALLAALAWLAATLGVYVIVKAVLPDLTPMAASLWIVAALALAVAAGVSGLGWWRAVGYTDPAEWRDTAWLAVPALLTLLPLVTGIRPLEAGVLPLLVAGYALTGFAEETMFRGVLVRLLQGRSPSGIAAITAILFGLVHLSNILIRGNPPVIFAQAVGAAAFGFGYAAIRQRTNSVVPLIATHMLTDLFLQLGRLPLIPVAVVQDVILFGAGLWLLRGSGPARPRA